MFQPHIENSTIPDVEPVQENCFDQVHIAYPGCEDILKDVTWKVSRGQMLGVTGEIASGKTAIGKIFIGEADYQGRVMINGRELVDYTDAENRHDYIYGT